MAGLSGNNDAVSFNEIQTFGLSLKSGQSHVNSDECIIKSQLIEKYVVDETLYSLVDKLDYELIEKRDCQFTYNVIVVVNSLFTGYVSNISGLSPFEIPVGAAISAGATLGGFHGELSYTSIYISTTGCGFGDGCDIIINSSTVGRISTPYGGLFYSGDSYTLAITDVIELNFNNNS